MRCADALVKMLDADLAELRLTASTPLVEHLRTCARCCAVASSLVRRTEAVALVVGSAVDRRRLRLAWLRPIAAGLAAAAICVALLAPRGPLPRQSAMPTIGGAAPLTQNRGAALRTETLPRQQVAAPIRAVAISAQRFNATRTDGDDSVVRISELAAQSGISNAVSAHGISVATPRGLNATIYGTRDSTVTVVWLAPDDTTRRPR